MDAKRKRAPAYSLLAPARCLGMHYLADMLNRYSGHIDDVCARGNLDRAAQRFRAASWAWGCHLHR